VGGAVFVFGIRVTNLDSLVGEVGTAIATISA
jgi:hypothetical protein